MISTLDPTILVLGGELLNFRMTFLLGVKRCLRDPASVNAMKKTCDRDSCIFYLVST